MLTLLVSVSGAGGAGGWGRVGPPLFLCVGMALVLAHCVQKVGVCLPFKIGFFLLIFTVIQNRQRIIHMIFKILRGPVISLRNDNRLPESRKISLCSDNPRK